MRDSCVRTDYGASYALEFWSALSTSAGDGIQAIVSDPQPAVPC